MLLALMFAGVFIVAFLTVCEHKGGGWRKKLSRSRATQPELYQWADCDYRTDPPKVLDYGYIDWLERELEVGRYDPLILESARDVREYNKILHERHVRCHEPIHEFSRGGVLRTYIDSDGNQTAIRAFGS